MQTAQRAEFVCVEDYLEGEKASEVRHEYIDGVVYAMAGSTDDHNLIGGSIYAALRGHLRGKRCQPFFADMKVRMEFATHGIFYYPDVLVACDSRDTAKDFRRYPQVIVEVLSETTERTDRREKFLYYTQIETLQEYVLVAQDRLEATVFRRANKWVPEIVRKSEDQLQLPSLEFAMPLSAVYEGVKL